MGFTREKGWGKVGEAGESWPPNGELRGHLNCVEHKLSHAEPRMGLKKMAWPSLAEQISGVCQGRRPVGQYLKLKWGHESKKGI